MERKKIYIKGETKRETPTVKPWLVQAFTELIVKRIGITAISKMIDRMIQNGENSIKKTALMIFYGF